MNGWKGAPIYTHYRVKFSHLFLLLQNFLSFADPWYREVGETIVNSLNYYTKVAGGFASIRDVTTMQLEDHQHSFFLSETCKYLYLLFDDTFLDDQSYIFTTEGHPLPIRSSWHEKLPDTYIPSNWTSVKTENQAIRLSAMALQICPAMGTSIKGNTAPIVESACHVPDIHANHRCKRDDECGIDSTSCRQRTCSMAGYCGLWSFIGWLYCNNIALDEYSFSDNM